MSGAFTLVTTDAPARVVAPNVGLVRSGDHHYRHGDGPWLPGVTSVIEKIDKGHRLKKWNRAVVADAALDNLERLTAMMANGGRKPAKAWLTAQAQLITDDAKELGTQVHAYAESLGRGLPIEVVPDELLPYVRAYQQFRVDWAPDYRSLEHYVVNLTAGYGGTFDFIALMDLGKGPKWTLGDYKTGKSGVYVETRLQLSALANAEFLGLPGDPTRYPLPAFEQYVVLHLRPGLYPSGYQLFEVTLTALDYEAFLGALAIYKWSDAGPTNGEPLPPPNALLNQLESSLEVSLARVS